MQIKNIALLPSLIKDYLKLVNQLKSNPDFKITKLFPILSDKKDSGGLISGHYFHQDLVVAQKIYNSNPEKHVDIASRVDGFVAHVAVFREIEIFDIRPINSKVRNIKFVLADLMDQGSAYENYCDSISCLHAIEHFGLGRYNDPIDADGHLKGLKSICKILKSGGKFYFSTPIGPQRIEFNAHRVFSIHYLLQLFKDDFELMSFSYVDDAGDLHENQILTEQQIKSNFNCHYGCGIFELKKK
jgi:SAM-dependent methyltransferase